MTLQQLELLVANPREALDIEVKTWLDLSESAGKACLAKAILALANHGGGYVLIGFDEEGGGFRFAGRNPYQEDAYSQDAINGIVRRYADPAFHCEVHGVPANSADECTVVVVPGGHDVPVRAKRGGPNGNHVAESAYYVRLPGPESAVPKCGKDWDLLIRRCLRNAKGELLEDFRRVLRGDAGEVEDDSGDELALWAEEAEGLLRARIEKHEAASDETDPFRQGYFAFVYTIDGLSEVQGLRDFRDTLASIRGLTGGPPWRVYEDVEVAPKVQGDAIEHFSSGYFWRAHPEGRLFQATIFQEDELSERRDVTPGRDFSVSLPIWRLGEALHHAEQAVAVLGTEGARVHFRARWVGLAGRRLVAWPDRHFNWDLWPGHGYECQEQSFQSEVIVGEEDLTASLPEVVGRMLEPLYERFGFYRLSRKAVEAELERLRKRR